MRPALALSLLLTLITSARAADDLATARALASALDRAGSQVMVRAVERSDRASLDVAAWDRNPLFHYPLTDQLIAPAPVASVAELSFGGALDPATIRDTFADTPLTEAERARPLAWQPLTKYLLERDYDRAAPLLVAGAPVSAERWGNAGFARPLQQIALAYLHSDQLWVKVEFRPEVTWVPATDEDGDGYREVYARLAIDPLAPELRALIADDYIGRALSSEEVDDYFYALCSEWYQSLQTYLLEGEEARPWPNATTDPAAAAQMGGQAIEAPTAVIRGVPHGQPIYNVFVVADTGERTANEPAAAAMPATQDAGALPAGGAWAEELARWGGSWEAWAGLLTRFRAEVRGLLQDMPEGQSGIAVRPLAVSREDWLFFKGDLQYLLAGDLREQHAGKDPWPAIIDFRDQLAARNVDLLLVVIPTKAEVYPEKLAAHAPGVEGPWVAPQCRKFLSELDAAGVGVVDLLPAFMAARDADPVPLYMPQDTHWTPRGLNLAARLIAQRVREYPWLAQTGAQPERYGLRPASCTRLGDIVGMLPEAERAAYRPMQLEAQQVVGADETLYTDDPASPLVMLGDSFTGVFQFEDCKHAGVSAHLARELGLPIDLIMAQGSGPRIRGQLARRGPEGLADKRLVIWTMVSRDLYNYWADWEVIKLP